MAGIYFHTGTRIVPPHRHMVWDKWMKMSVAIEPDLNSCFHETFVNSTFNVRGLCMAVHKSNFC